MTRALLHAAELTVLAGIAVGAHRYVVRRRGPLAEALEKLAGTSMRAVAAIADTVAGLLYAAFALAVVPAAGESTVRAAEVESALDTVAVFALLVALVQVVAYLVLYRVAHHLEPWPPHPTLPADG